MIFPLVIITALFITASFFLISLETKISLILISVLSLALVLCQVPLWLDQSGEILYANMGLESLNWALRALLVFILLISLLACWATQTNLNSTIFLFNVLALILIIILTFNSLHLLNFYIMFEISLLPIFFIVLGWGYQPERLGARIALLFYTLTASLPLLLTIIWLSNNSYYSFFFLNSSALTQWAGIHSFFLSFILLTGFLVKLPIFSLHQWLPKAHVEAPVVGSMILAAVLLKLGGFGLYRLLNSISLNADRILFISSVTAVGGGLIAILCLRQLDIKVLIAYSSVRHMAFTAVGYLSGITFGVLSATLIIIRHGVCSSALFAGANTLYQRSHSRLITLNKGTINFLPSFSFFWFIICLGNIGAPPTVNCVREILGVITCINLSDSMTFPVVLLTFFAAAYTLVLYRTTQHGRPRGSSFSPIPLTNADSWLYFSHFIWLGYLSLAVTIFF